MTEQLTLDQDIVDFDDHVDADDEIIATGKSLQSWWHEANRQLTAIEALPHGWDSHGGEAPDPRIINGARAFLRSLSTSNLVAKPHVNPTPSGGVQFHWEKDARYFEIEFVDECTAQYYFVDRSENEENEGIMRVGDSMMKAVELAIDVEMEP